MAQAMVTDHMVANAQRLIANPQLWSRARSKRDGRAFWLVQGTTGAYYVSTDGCTCRGYQHRGICSHAVAARLRAGVDAESARLNVATEAEVEVAAGELRADLDARAEARRARAAAYRALFANDDDDTCRVDGCERSATVRGSTCREHHR